MSYIEIGAGVVLALCSIVIILVVLVQDSKDDGLTSAIGGGYNDSFYGKNAGNTRDAKLNRLTRNAAIVMFVLTIAVSIIHKYLSK
ncbi:MULTISPECIES: preprotein translocase subunit SecG [Ruminococcus]|uniref:Protein-export membrane protein SecG n=1 Tax=Ruminococcus albus (strain ATCC 27210 / DSM 20455 / JCM 14654 / NCDO 2250 / 7) TaxID=697329 RepID=E6UG91_RUMA7|nr:MULTISPECIES: preprotein translocase subunit SecG [Ruminococcus]ADU21118.1 preprotein translocase, SecG subunit [Ruminococcus albus 7 = DSM 20455]MCR5020759.1 preprotein translocase subunit SecG [Ruminococcus sp.]